MELPAAQNSQRTQEFQFVDLLPDPENWSFDVFVTGHKYGLWSRVLISRELVPNWYDAYADAACMAAGIHGGMITDVLPRY